MRRSLRILGLAVALVLVVSSVAAAAPPPVKVTDLQKEFGVMQQQLFAVRNSAEAEAAAARMNGLVQQMMRDPAYAAKLKEAEGRLRAAMAAKAAADLKKSGVAASRATSVASSFTTTLATSSTTASTLSTAAWGSLARADVMHINNKGLINLWAMYYSHSGTYNGGGYVYESNTDGVRLKPLANWQQGQPVALGRTNGKTYADRTAALNWAEAKYGTDGRTPYNYNFVDKWTDSALYCSQLVWKIHGHMGLNVDSNDWRYLAWLTARYGLLGTTVGYYAVAPDEIFLSPLITYYSVGNG